MLGSSIYIVFAALGSGKMTGAPTAGPCMPGNLLAILGTITSALTVLIGLIYVYNKPPSFEYVWSDCTWTFPDKESTDCNMKWQSNWGVMCVLKYTPLIFGILGSAMFQPGMMQVVGFPRNFLQYGLFLWLQGFYGDMGYCGKLGVIVGFLSCIVGTICLVASLFDLKSSRMMRLQEEFKHMYVEEEPGMEYASVAGAGAVPVMAGVAGAAVSPSAKGLFEKFDTDGDGVISRQEYSSGISAGLRR